jgi:putative transposase
VKYACIREHRGQFPVRMMCRLLGVGVSGFYAWLRRPESRRGRANRRLLVEIRVAHRRSHGIYGSPRVYEDLRAEGHGCSRKRVARLMRLDGLAGRQRRKFKHTTDSNHAHSVAENLLEQCFTAEKRDEIWVSDITYIPTREGWLYLAATMDLYSRRIVGWSVKSSLARGLVMETMAQAIVRRMPGPGLIHHSDRGVQYACGDFQNLLRAHGMTCSMSGAGNCYDNAAMESFFHSLKVEWIHGRTFTTREEARRSLSEYIETFYNSWRRHSTLGMISPAEFERQRLAA